MLNLDMEYSKIEDNIEEWLIKKEYPLPDSPNITIPKIQNNCINKKISRKQRSNFIKERKWQHIIDNTIILSPDWIINKRTKIFFLGLQLDLESFIIGLFFGIFSIVILKN